MYELYSPQQLVIQTVITCSNFRRWIYNLYPARPKKSQQLGNQGRGKYAMPRISTVTVFRATFALIFFVLVGQILLFTLTRCRGFVAEEDPNRTNRELSNMENLSVKFSSLSKKIRQLKREMGNLKRENNALTKAVRDLSSRNEGLLKEIRPVSYTHLTLPTIYSV